MNKIYRLITLLFVLSFCSFSTWAASSWRCSGGLVVAGDSQAEVFDRCGAPTTKNFLGWGRRVVNGWGVYFEDVPLEEWVYSVSDRQYYVLKFEGNVLREVKSHYSS